MLKVFEDANLKLLSVFSNVNGVTCTRIIDEILKGNTAPDYLAFLCTHGKLQSSKEQIRDAVEGMFTEHHKFMLKAIRRSIASLEEEIAELEAEIDRRCEPVQEDIERLCTIPGIDKTGTKELISEIGVNMLNATFIRLKYAYRVVEDLIVEITNDEEIKTIETAIEQETAIKTHFYVHSNF